MVAGVNGINLFKIYSIANGALAFLILLVRISTIIGFVCAKFHVFSHISELSLRFDRMLAC